MRKVLPDFQHVLRDVCRACNADLSAYDSASSLLAAEIAESHDATGKQLSFSPDTLGWLLKTHLNNIRAARDSATGEKYMVDAAIYRALLSHARVPDDRYVLFVEGWAGERNTSGIPNIPHAFPWCTRFRSSAWDGHTKPSTTWIFARDSKMAGQAGQILHHDFLGIGGRILRHREGATCGSQEG
jgi:hypothetical protein